MFHVSDVVVLSGGLSSTREILYIPLKSILSSFRKAFQLPIVSPSGPLKSHALDRTLPLP